MADSLNNKEGYKFTYFAASQEFLKLQMPSHLDKDFQNKVRLGFEAHRQGIIEILTCFEHDLTNFEKWSQFQYRCIRTVLHKVFFFMDYDWRHAYQLSYDLIEGSFRGFGCQPLIQCRDCGLVKDAQGVQATIPGVWESDTTIGRYTHKHWPNTSSERVYETDEIYPSGEDWRMKLDDEQQNVVEPLIHFLIGACKKGRERLHTHEFMPAWSKYLK